MDPNTQKACPHCGAPLPTEASFCPYCAKSVTRREALAPPRRMPGRVFFRVLPLIFAAVLAAALWWSGQPRVYDNGGPEVLYSLNGQTYQLSIAYADTPAQPSVDRYTTLPLDFDARYPSLLYTNYADTGENAAGEFLPQVERVTAEIAQDGAAHDTFRVSCTPPAREADYVPGAASITYVDSYLWKAGEYEARLAFTVHMKNGDALRVWQTQRFQSIATYTYTPEDTPLNTTEELQALLDEIGRTVKEDADIEIRLPPVTYAGELTLDTLAVNLYGSVDGAGRRTAFTGPVRLDYPGGKISCFEGIDFLGQGGGTGIFAVSRLHLTGCRLSGWDTAVYCDETSWVNACQCTFADNGIGLHMNNALMNVSDDRYMDNLFQNNGTGVLLEQLGVDLPLQFSGTRFSGNGTDIDNRCGQPLDLSEAVFE